MTHLSTAVRDDGSCRISGIACRRRQLSVRWSDRRETIYHYIWLRDNCGCPVCGDKVSTSGERFFKLTEVPLDIAPEDAFIAEDGTLHIVWRAGGHTSTYDPAWLRAHDFSRPAEIHRPNRPVLWDAALNDNPPEIGYAEASSGDEGLSRLLDLIVDYGFALVRKMPLVAGEVERLAGLLGYIRETNYWRVFEIKTKPANRTLAETSLEIPPHNDELFRHAPPGVIVFHCLEASADGGGASILVDGFAIASRLREQDPEAFELLSRVSLPHRRYIAGVADLRAETPVIALDAKGEVTAFRCNERTLAPFDLPGDLVEPVYRALQQVLGLVYSPTMRVQFHLRPGDALVFDNQRVMHARTAFSGQRHIRQCHVDRDEVFSRFRLLGARSGRGAQQLA